LDSELAWRQRSAGFLSPPSSARPATSPP
jgi:hypothetical protein